MAGSEITLDVEGMTCAACVARVEKRLNALDGVHATVNLATERALVRFDLDPDPHGAIAAVEAAGYRARVAAPERAPSRVVSATVWWRLVISAGLAIPVIVVSMAPGAQFDGWMWVVAALAAPVVTWGAWPFHSAAARALRHGGVTMDTLVSLGVIVSTGWSTWALVWGGAGDPTMRMAHSLWGQHGSAGHSLYFEVAVGVTVFLLGGRYLEERAKRTSRDALRALINIAARDAVRRVDGRDELVRADDLAVGDVVVVRAGEKVPADGVVVKGRSSVDARLMTGESRPHAVNVGDRVVGATLNGEGPLLVRVTAVGSDTELARIGRLIDEAQTGRSATQRLADRVSAVFVPVVLALAALTLLLWLAVTSSLELAMSAAVATLIIACPCALGLATPMALMVATGRGSAWGILIRGPEVLESTRALTTIAFDKTGTLTSGTPHIVAIEPFGAVTRDDVLRVAAALEEASTHPLARAIRAEAPADRPASVDVTVLPGVGVVGVIEGERCWIGKHDVVYEAVGSDADSARVDEVVRLADERGESVVLVSRGSSLLGAVRWGDTLAPGAAAAVRAVVAFGARPVLVSGDRRAAAERVARAVGIDEVFAEVTPEGKVEVVRSLQRAGEVVAMVGDGVNDAAALARADLGIAMGHGSDVAIAAGDITLVDGDLARVADAIRLARRTLATIRVNLVWAFAYNTAAIPVAMLGFLSPLLAGLAMALSSLFVVGNSLRLRRFAPLAAT